MARRCALVPVLAAACGRVGFDHVVSAGGDGSVDAPDPPRCVSFGPWSPPQRIDELSIAGTREYVGQLMPDRVTFYFSRAGQHLVARRPTPTAPFDPPQALSTLGAGCCATVRRDDLELYDEASYMGVECIHRAIRLTTAAAWSASSIVSALCSGTTTEGAYLTADGLALYYNTATPPGDYLGTLMVTTRVTTDASFAAGTPVSGLTLGATKGYPVLSLDELTIYFETLSPADLYQATRASRTDPFGAPSGIAGVNSTSADQDAWVTEDGLELFFASDRITAGDLDLYRSTRTCL